MRWRLKLSKFATELRRRRVGRVAAGYAITAWLLVSVADTVLPRLLMPDWSVAAVILLAIAGFPIALILAWYYDIVPDRAGGMRGLRGQHWLGLGIGSLIIVLVAAGSARYWTAVVRPAGLVDSIVVLPFEDRTGQEGQEHFVGGLHSALINELAQIGALRVISRTSASRIADRGLSIPEIARELSVRGVLEGTVTRASDEVEIHVHLIQAVPAEQSLWARTYRRDIRSVVAMHGDIARAIAQQIKVELTPRQEARLSRESVVDPETYEAYLRGMHHLQRGSNRDVGLAIQYLRTAVDRDPADPMAWAGLATGYINLGHGVAPVADAWQHAREAALRAVQLDPELPQARSALAQVKYYYERDWDGAGREFRYANELNPSMAANRYHHAWYLATMGRMDEAIAEHELAKHLDPFTPLFTAWLGGLYYMAGRVDDAIREAQAAVAMAPAVPAGWLVLGDAFLLKGMHDDAVNAHRRLADLVPAQQWLLGRTLAATGQIEEARNIAALVEASEPNPWTTFGLGALHATLGDADRAFYWLEYGPPHAWMPAIRGSHWFAGLQGDPRLEQMLQRMGLAAN
jgi:TolB-like protein/Flp pilus assembly protein TadD